ncbi:MAG: hypothetical protein RR840_10910 [Clostridium sp.]
MLSTSAIIGLVCIGAMVIISIFSIKVSSKKSSDSKKAIDSKEDKME